MVYYEYKIRIEQPIAPGDLTRLLLRLRWFEEHLISVEELRRAPEPDDDYLLWEEPESRPSARVQS